MTETAKSHDCYMAFANDDFYGDWLECSCGWTADTEDPIESMVDEFVQHVIDSSK